MQMSRGDIEALRRVDGLDRALERLQGMLSGASLQPTYLTAPLTSTSWDGDAHSTTAKTLIDLSAVFGVPAGVRWVLVSISLRDSGSAASDCWLALSPNDTAKQGMLVSCLPVNDRSNRTSAIVPCNADGDIYYQIAASGSGTMDVYLQIWGYGW